MFVIRFGVGILSHTERLRRRCGHGEGWAQEEFHCWHGWLKSGWFLLCLLPWKSHRNGKSLRDLEQLFPQKMLWFDSGIYFANEGPESTRKSLSHQDLSSVWSCRNADGSLKHPIFPVAGIAVLPIQAHGWLWSRAHPTHLQRTSELSPPASVRAPKNHSFIYCILLRDWWNHTYWQISQEWSLKMDYYKFYPND